MNEMVLLRERQCVFYEVGSYVFKYCSKDFQAGNEFRESLILRVFIVIFVSNQLDAQFFFMYVYFYSVHVSGSHVPIIRRINCINTTSGICHSV